MNPVRPCSYNSNGGIPRWYYTYILQSKTNGHFYTGTTNNLNKRLKQHNNGLVFSSRYMLPLQLIYFEAFLDKDDAYHRERYLKSGMGKRYLKNRLEGYLTSKPRKRLTELPNGLERKGV